MGRMRGGHKPKGMGGEFGDRLHSASLINFSHDCFICHNPIKGDYAEVGEGNDLPIEEKRFYHPKKCGPGTLGWFLVHPTMESLLLLIHKKDPEMLRDYMMSTGYTREKIVENSAIRNEFVSYYKERRSKMMSKEDKKGKKGKGKKRSKTESTGAGRKNVYESLPAKVLSNPDVGKMICQLRDGEGDPSKLRRQLRAKGFKLSDESTWELFNTKKANPDLKAAPKPKKEKAEKKGGKVTKKGKKGKETEEDLILPKPTQTKKDRKKKEKVSKVKDKKGKVTKKPKGKLSKKK